MRKKLNAVIRGGGLLRIIFLSGVIFLVLAGGVLTAFFIMERNGSKEARQLDTFARMLYEYDLLAREMSGTDKEPDRLNRELESLEKRAISVESWLSILKRRRILARAYPSSIENYRISVNKALEIYPASKQIAAAASELLVKNKAITSETEETLRNFLPLFTGTAFNDLRLSLHVILGDFNSPQRAAVIPSELFSDGTKSVSTDLTILRILRGDIISAAGDVQTMLHSESLSDETLRFAAEFYYDFGDINRSAELFSFINDDKAMIRQADALYLAGYTESARNIWSMLSDSQPPVERSLYNLGVTAQNGNEAVFWFDKLINLQTEEINDSLQFGLIRYSRLLETPEAVSLLGSVENLKPALYPFIDLEIIKRQSRNWELGRQIAEAWLLLDRHDNNETLYFWTAWLFLFQRNYSEIKILLNRMEILGFSMQWVKVFRAIELMFEGELETAEETLRSIPAEDTWWAVYANLGCILEAQRSSGRAAGQYELAAEKTQNPKTASKLQVRIARCYMALGQPLEARRALEKAVELDPENLTAKLELDRTLSPY